MAGCTRAPCNPIRWYNIPAAVLLTVVHSQSSGCPLYQDLYIRIDGFNTRYWKAGEEGTPLVLVHGLAVSADIWKNNIPGLSREHRVYVPDLIGFGRSDRPGASFSPFEYGRFLDGFLSSLNLGRVSLVGQSLGGAIAIHYAQQFPQKIDKLVLVGSAGLGREVIWTLRAMSIPLVAELLYRPSRKAVDFLFKLSVRNPTLITPEFVETYYQIYIQPEFRRFFLRFLRRILTIRGPREEFFAPLMKNLSRITQPVLIVWGQEDRVLPVKHAYFGMEKIPNARLEIFPACGHIPFFERPEEFNRLVLEFLSE